jgi:hypothetical protein
MAGMNCKCCGGCNPDTCPEIVSVCYKIDSFDSSLFPQSTLGDGLYSSHPDLSEWNGRFIAAGTNQCTGIAWAGASLSSTNHGYNNFWLEVNGRIVFATIVYYPEGNVSGLSTDPFCTWWMQWSKVVSPNVVVIGNYRKVGGSEPAGTWTAYDVPSGWPATLEVVRDTDCVGVSTGAISVTPDTFNLDAQAQTIGFALDNTATLTITNGCTYRTRVTATSPHHPTGSDWITVAPNPNGITGALSPSTVDYTPGITVPENTTGSPRSGTVIFDLLCDDVIIDDVTVTVNQSTDLPCTTPVAGDLPDTLTLTTSGIDTPCGDGDGPGNDGFTLTRSGTTYASGDGAWQGYYSSGKWFFDYIDPVSEEVLISLFVAAGTYDCAPQLGDMKLSEGQCGSEGEVYGVLS